MGQVLDLGIWNKEQFTHLTTTGLATYTTDKGGYTALLGMSKFLEVEATQWVWNVWSHRYPFLANIPMKLGRVGTLNIKKTV
jgi:hypothetical protein